MVLYSIRVSNPQRHPYTQKEPPFVREQTPLLQIKAHLWKQSFKLNCKRQGKWTEHQKIKLIRNIYWFWLIDYLYKPLSPVLSSQNTFHFNSGYWSDKSEYNLPGGETGFDSQEMKLPSYWNTPFTKICLGMKIGQQINFIVINKQANSLYSLIADGQYRASLLGRNAWKVLIGSQAYLQSNCNKEGFNAMSGSTTLGKSPNWYH